MPVINNTTVRQWSSRTRMQVQTTAEAIAIVLAGVGTLCAVLGPKLLTAKEELGNKALIGPISRGASSSDVDGGDLDDHILCMGTGAIHGGGGEADAAGGVHARRAAIGALRNNKSPRSSAGLAYSKGAQVTSSSSVTLASTGGKQRGGGGRGEDRGVGTPSSSPPDRTLSASRPTSPTLAGEGRTGDRECKVAGSGTEGSERGEGGVARPLPLASGFCTPPSLVRRSSRSTGADGNSTSGTVGHIAAGNSGDGDDQKRGAAQSERVGNVCPPSAAASVTGSSDQSQTSRSRERGRTEARGERQGVRGSSMDGGANTNGEQPRSERRSSKPPLSGASGSSRSGHGGRGRGGGDSGGRSGTNSSSVNDNGSRRSSVSSSSRGSSRTRQTSKLSAAGRGGGGSSNTEGDAPAGQQTSSLLTSHHKLPPAAGNNTAAALRDAGSLSPLSLAMMNGNSSALFSGAA